MKEHSDIKERYLYNHNLGRALKLTIYLLALWSCSATTLTQIFSPLFMLIMYLLILSSWFKERLKLLQSGWLWHPLTVLVFIYSLGNFMYNPAFSVFLLLNYLTVNKLFNLWSTRDYAQLIVVNFFQILFTSVITSSLTFAFLFGGYIILLVSTLILLNCQRDYISAAKLVLKRSLTPSTLMPTTPDMNQSSLLKFLRPLLTSVFFYWAIILFLMVQFFMLLPRLAGEQFLPNILGLQQETSSGFSEDISLGSDTSISLDPTIVMRIQILSAKDETKQPVNLSSIRIRGATLDYFDGQRWLVSPELQGYAYQHRFLHEAILSKEFLPSSGSIEVTQRIMLQPMQSNYLFAIDHPYRFHFPAGPLLLSINDEAGTVRMGIKPRSSLTYEAQSIFMPDQQKIISGKLQFPEVEQTEDISKVKKLYLQLPARENLEQLRSFARQISGTETSMLTAALNIERYLQSNYTYSLNVSGVDVIRPVSDFLFRTRKGYCDQFSSAMCVLLRCLEIPARIVGGYWTDEWNPFGGYFIVRESNAHSWVETWIEGYGWLTLDPTPPQSLPVTSSRKGLFVALSHLLDSFKLNWYRYVIDFDLDDQLRLRRVLGINVRAIYTQPKKLLDRLLYFNLPQPASRIRLLALLMMIFFAISGLIILLISVLNLGKWQSWWRQWLLKVTASTHNRRKQITQLYLRILKRLKKYGYKPLPGQTPLEFALSVTSHNQQLIDFVNFTKIYYQGRFGNYALTREELKIINNLFKLLKLPSPIIF